MTVSSSLLSSLRFFSKLSFENSQDLSPLDDSIEFLRPTADQLYTRGSQFSQESLTQTTLEQNKSRPEAIARIIANFNSEPLFPGNSFILFNKPRIFRAWTPIAVFEALDLLKNAKPIRIDLARVRPAPSETLSSQVQIVPMSDFNYQVQSEAEFITWWHTVGRNFCDRVF